VFKLPVFSIKPTAWARAARPILERLAFAVYLLAAISACGLIALGLIFALFMAEVRPLCLGLAGGAFVRLFQQHGYRQWHFAQWEDSFEPSDAPDGFLGESARSDRAAQLERLLHELEAGGRDVWAVQDLRHQIKALLAAEPALRESYAQELAGHPELG
jgi:hypothetical protein